MLTQGQSSNEVTFALAITVITILSLDLLLFVGSDLGWFSILGIQIASMHLVVGTISDQKLWGDCDHSQIITFFAFASDGLWVPLTLAFFGSSLRRRGYRLPTDAS